MFVDPNGEFATAVAAATAPAWLLYAAAGVAALGAGIAYFAEHHKKGTTNPANKAKHQKGQKRKQTDKYGGEKGDARRTPRNNKRR